MAPNKNMVDENGVVHPEGTVTPTMYYYSGSELSIEWTNQHGMGTGFLNPLYIAGRANTAFADQGRSSRSQLFQPERGLQGDLKGFQVAVVNPDTGGAQTDCGFHFLFIVGLQQHFQPGGQHFIIQAFQFGRVQGRNN